MIKDLIETLVQMIETLVQMREKIIMYCKYLLALICINYIYIKTGILYEKISKSSYQNTENNNSDLFRSSIGFSVVINLVTWLLSEIHCRIRLQKQEYVVIEKKKSFICGLAIVVSLISFMEAMKYLSYPFIMLAKSSSILQAFLTSIFYNTAKDHNNRVGFKHVINSLFIIFGVILFKVYDSESSFKIQIRRQNQLLGLLILLVNLCADSFLPIFQTPVNNKFQPKSLQFMAEINKFSFIICFICSIFTGDLAYTFSFITDHPVFSHEILALAILYFLGQTFIYRMIKVFKSQNISLIILNGRKTLTVLITLALFHRTTFQQISGIFIAFVANIWQNVYLFFSMQLKNKNTKQIHKFQKISDFQNQITAQKNSFFNDESKELELHDRQLLSIKQQIQDEEEKQVLRNY